MREQIRNLAQLLAMKREGSKFVLMLGAGASMSSGVPSTPQIMQELVDRYGQGLEGEFEDRFDELWRQSSEDDRRGFLDPYLQREPSEGYEHLAALIREGFFDLGLTFNFDNLLEKALQAAGFHDFKVVIRGETEDGKMARLVDRPQAAFTLLKLHGSLFSTDTFLFSKEEMSSYPPEIEGLLQRITARDIVICGYAFSDACVLRAFASEGNSIFCVNPSGIPSLLKGIMIRRRSKSRAIAGELGKFDAFFTALHEEIEDRRSDGGSDRPQLNPFKFLSGYDVSNRDWFFGRRKLVEATLAQMEASKPPILHFAGPRKSGKSSFIRAGLLAHLDPERFQSVYLRCRPGALDRLAAEAGAGLGLDPPPATVAELVTGIERTSTKHVLLVLDQFERLLPGAAGVEEDSQWRLLAFLDELCSGGEGGKLTAVIVTVDDKEYYKLLLASKLKPEWKKPQEVALLPTRRVRAILRLLAWKAGLALDRRIIDRLGERYEERRESRNPFTLAHLQAVCYLAVASSATSWDQFGSIANYELDSIFDLAINECDVMNFVEDLPIKEERLLVRKLMKVVSGPSKRQIATYLRDRFDDLSQDEVFPEPLA